MIPRRYIEAYLFFLLRNKYKVSAIVTAVTLFFVYYMWAHMQIVVETPEGTIFDDPETFKKVDRITVDLLHNVPGVNGEQVLSVTHPKLKTTLIAGTGIKVVPLTYPRLPDNKE